MLRSAAFRTIFSFLNLIAHVMKIDTMCIPKERLEVPYSVYISDLSAHHNFFDIFFCLFHALYGVKIDFFCLGPPVVKHWSTVYDVLL
jgi:hypothetical protein